MKKKIYILDFKIIIRQLNMNEDENKLNDSYAQRKDAKLQNENFNKDFKYKDDEDDEDKRGCCTKCCDGCNFCFVSLCKVSFYHYYLVYL